MEHVKGRIGSFWGQSAISKKDSRIWKIYGKDSEDEIDNSF